MNEHNEKPIILVIVTFFLAMTLVYIAFFRTQPWLLNSTSTDTVVDTTLMSWLIDNITTWTLDLSWTLDQWIDLSSWSNNTISWSLWNTTGILDISSDSLSSASWKDKASKISWVKPWYGSISMAELLWLSITEAFVDTWSTQYGYLGTGSLDTLASTVRRLWWNVLAIETENDISRNSLRWDRVLFINIPQVTFVRQPTEQKLLVAMVIVIDNDKWIVESKIARYYSSKKFMKSFFEQLYWKKL